MTGLKNTQEWVKHCVCEDFQRSCEDISGLSWGDGPSVWPGTIQSSGDEKRTKKERKRASPSPAAETLYPPALGHQNTRLSGLGTPRFAPVARKFSGLWPPTEGSTIGYPGSEAFGLELSHFASIPGPSACTWPVVGLLGFHYCGSQLT